MASVVCDEVRNRPHAVTAAPWFSPNGGDLTAGGYERFLSDPLLVERDEFSPLV